jgi:Ca2+-transporting ATPase
VRSSVPGAVARFRAAGVRVVMITGDHASTARAIAAQAGLDLAGGVCTLSELAELPEDARADRVARVNVFARVTPEGKLMLVRALAARGEIVAMTGDGVNDAPALKAAQIGIALGARATDVAREAAALVLTGDDFGTIADAMVLGRRIYENLRRAMLYVIAVHVPIAALSLLPVLLGEPALLLPVHVMFLEMIIDPACTLAFEAETPDAALLARPSRRVGDSLFDRRSLVTGVLQGSVLGLAVLGLYTYALRSQASVDVARATAFSALVLGNLALIAVQRSRTRSAFSEMFRSKNAAATWVTGLATLALVLMLVVPGLRHLAHFALPPAALLGWALVTGLASVLWFDATKWRRQPR